MHINVVTRRVAKRALSTSSRIICATQINGKLWPNQTQNANVPPPMCVSCKYGKATRRPWRTRAKEGQATKHVVINAPGDCVSVDQLESPTPGFIRQVKGFLTMQRYRMATIFVDHYSGLGYIYLQEHSTRDARGFKPRKLSRLMPDCMK
jgi:hypothetical protein